MKRWPLSRTVALRAFTEVLIAVGYALILVAAVALMLAAGSQAATFVYNAF
jgi:hypothetical protein